MGWPFFFAKMLRKGQSVAAWSRRVTSARLSKPAEAACCGTMLASLKPGTPLISMTWAGSPGTIIMSTRAMPAGRGFRRREVRWIAVGPCRVRPARQA